MYGLESLDWMVRVIKMKMMGRLDGGSEKSSR